MQRNESQVSKGDLRPITDILSAFPSLLLTASPAKQPSNNSSENSSFNPENADAEFLSLIFLNTNGRPSPLCLQGPIGILEDIIFSRDSPTFTHNVQKPDSGELPLWPWWLVWLIHTETPHKYQKNKPRQVQLCNSGIWDKWTMTWEEEE